MVLPSTWPLDAYLGSGPLQMQAHADPSNAVVEVELGVGVVPPGGRNNGTKTNSHTSQDDDFDSRRLTLAMVE
jgi:hypothetical protein